MLASRAKIQLACHISMKYRRKVRGCCVRNEQVRIPVRVRTEPSCLTEEYLSNYDTVMTPSTANPQEAEKR
eukprot:2396156-Amphidinium_carterae.1